MALPSGWTSGGWSTSGPLDPIQNINWNFYNSLGLSGLDVDASHGAYDQMVRDITAKLNSDPSYVLTPQDYLAFTKTPYEGQVDLGQYTQARRGDLQTSKDNANKSDFMADWGFLLPIGAAAGVALGAGALGGLGAAEGAGAAAGAEGFGAGALGSWDAVGGLTAAESSALGGGGGLFGGGYSGEGLTQLVSDGGGETVWNGSEYVPTPVDNVGVGGDSMTGGFMDWLKKVSPSTWVSLGGSLLGSGIGYLGATKAADAQRDASNQAQNTIWNMYQQNRADLEPWRTAGVGALGSLRDLTTPGKQLDTAMLDPGYGFGLSEGLKAGDARLRAMGMANSGSAVKAATRFGNDYATKGFNDVYNRLANLAGLGQVGTTAGIAAGSNAANNVAGLQTQAGNARASGYMGGANAVSGGIGQGINLYNQLALLDSLKRS